MILVIHCNVKKLFFVSVKSASEVICSQVHEYLYR